MKFGKSLFFFVSNEEKRGVIYVALSALFITPAKYPRATRELLRSSCFHQETETHATKVLLASFAYPKICCTLSKILNFLFYDTMGTLRYQAFPNIGMPTKMTRKMSCFSVQNVAKIVKIHDSSDNNQPYGRRRLPICPLSPFHGAPLIP